ncbi:MAG: hypothetical protein R3Y58_07975 [Eubacteriales bacterium]
MDEKAKRRQELLASTRELYSDRGRVIPAVHPRYGSIYNELYKEEETGEKSSFRARFIIAMLLFVSFACAEYNNMKIGDYNCDEIAAVVSQNIEIAKVLEQWQ